MTSTPIDESTANKLRACARELLESATGKDQRERIFHAIAAIAWESGEPGFDASPIFHAFSDAMSILAKDAGVEGVDVLVRSVDGTATLYRPNAEQPTLHDVGWHRPKSS